MLGTQESPNELKTLNRGFALKINELYSHCLLYTSDAADE